MTAVADSSNKVGGKKTLIVVLRPLARSAQLRAQLPKTYAVALAATKKNQLLPGKKKKKKEKKEALKASNRPKLN